MLTEPKSAIWRRLLVIAAEDVGIASTDAVIAASFRSTDKKMRQWLGGEELAIFQTVHMLAAAPKDRSADYLISVAKHDPDHEGVREQCGGNPVARRLEFLADPTWSLSARAVAAWYGSGVEAWPQRRVGAGDIGGTIRTFAGLGVPWPLLGAVSIAARKTRETITIFLPLLWLAVAKEQTKIADDPAPATLFVDGVPCCALDGHTRIGRQAIERFSRQNDQVANFLNRHVADFKSQRPLQLAVFFADSARISKRLVWRDSEQLENDGIAADFIGAGVDPDVGGRLVAMVRANLDHLNDIRAELLKNQLTATIAGDR
jgi:hypothetical protein